MFNAEMGPLEVTGAISPNFQNPLGERLFPLFAEALQPLLYCNSDCLCQGFTGQPGKLVDQRLGFIAFYIQARVPPFNPQILPFLNLQVRWDQASRRSGLPDCPS